MKFDKLKIWAVTDGSQGMISQVMGLSKHISNNILEIESAANLIAVCATDKCNKKLAFVII